MNFDIDDFFEIEKKYDAFDIKVNGVYIWERIRFRLYRALTQAAGVGKVFHPKQTNRNWLYKTKEAFTFIRNTIQKNPFLPNKKDILVFGHPRRKKDESGLWWDIYCDPFFLNLYLDYIHVEKPYLSTHRKPTVTPNLKFLDLVDVFKGIPLPNGIPKLNISSNDKLLLQNIEEEIRQEFEIKIDLMDMVQSSIQKRFLSKWLYKLLLKAIDPNLVIIVVSYTNETFIETCKDFNIPVVELQHGYLSKTHVGYHFPAEASKRTFPDYFFTFGTYWQEKANFPINENKIIPIGYPYLDLMRKKYSDIETENIILFISQGTIGKELSKFANALSKKNIDYDIIYKLHPGECNNWKTRYPWLNINKIEVVDSETPILYKLFAKSKIQIGVNSTALYEGLSFGLKTYIFQHHSWSFQNQLIKEGLGKEVKSVEELLDKLGGGIDMDENLLKSLFTENSLENFEREIRLLLGLNKEA